MKKHLYVLNCIPNRIIETEEDMLRDDLYIIGTDGQDFFARLPLSKFQAILMKIQINMYNKKNSTKISLRKLVSKRNKESYI